MRPITMNYWSYNCGRRKAEMLLKSINTSQFTWMKKEHKTTTTTTTTIVLQKKTGKTLNFWCPNNNIVAKWSFIRLFFFSSSLFFFRFFSYFVVGVLFQTMYKIKNNLLPLAFSRSLALSLDAELKVSSTEKNQCLTFLFDCNFVWIWPYDDQS